MAEVDQNLVWFLIGIIIIQGVWMAGLTYLMWRSAQKRKEETTKST